jgi:hypothetical protein
MLRLFKKWPFLFLRRHSSLIDLFHVDTHDLIPFSQKINRTVSFHLQNILIFRLNGYIRMYMFCDA